jgi:hypothetical protein
LKSFHRLRNMYPQILFVANNESTNFQISSTVK